MAPQEDPRPQGEPIKWHPAFFDAIQLELLDCHNVILRANSKMIREVLNMSKNTLTLEAVLEEAGLIAKYEARGEAKAEARGEARGEEKARCEIARNLLSLGWTIEQTAQTSLLPIEKVQALYAAMLTNGD
jgi:predicted transposase YdaD